MHRNMKVALKERGFICMYDLSGVWKDIFFNDFIFAIIASLQCSVSLPPLCETHDWMGKRPLRMNW